MLLENRIGTPIIITGQSYDPTRKYIVGEVVRATVSGESRGWILLVDAPAGTAPRANSAFWAIFTNTLMTNRGAQGLPAPTVQARYSADGNPPFRPDYVDGDLFREVSYDGGTTWTRERIRGDRGEQGIPGVGHDGIDGENAPRVIWQYAADPPDEDTALEWKDSYVQGDVWKHWSNDGGTTWGPAERILGKDGRDGFDLELQYADSADGPWDVHDTGQHWIRSRVGNKDPFGPPINRTGEAHTTSEVTEAQVRTLAAAAARARYTDDEKAKLTDIEDSATRDQTPEEIRDALHSIGFNLDDEIVDMHDGLRAATVDDYGKLGLGPDGILYRVKRTAEQGHDASGIFTEYTHANFRGVSRDAPNLPLDNQIYYNSRRHQWYIYLRDPITNVLIGQPIRATQALGANTVWIGEVDDSYQAVHAIQNFDNTKAYYAVYSGTLNVLDNSTYTPPTGVTYSYEWVRAIPDDVVTVTELALALADYVTQESLNTILDDYVTESELTTQLEDYVEETDFNPLVQKVSELENEIDKKVDDNDFYVDFTPRYCRFDQLRQNLVLTWSHIPNKYSDAVFYRFFIDGVPAIERNVWNPTNNYILFSLIAQNIDNILSNTESNQFFWDGELVFYDTDSVEIDREKVPIVINRSPAPSGSTSGSTPTPTEGVTATEAASIAEEKARDRYTDTEKQDVAKIDTIESGLASLKAEVDALEPSAGVTEEQLNTFLANYAVPDITIYPNQIRLTEAERNWIIDLHEIYAPVTEANSVRISLAGVPIRVNNSITIPFSPGTVPHRIEFAIGKTDADNIASTGRTRWFELEIRFYKDSQLLFTRVALVFIDSSVDPNIQIRALSERFGGKELLPKTGAFPYQVIPNANAALTDAIATNDTRFSNVPLFANAQNNNDDKYLSQFDRLLFEVYLLNASNAPLASTSFTMSYTQWSSIRGATTTPVSSTNQVDATVEDGRAVIHNWRTKDKPITPVDTSGGTVRNQINLVETNIRNWITSFRNIDHTVYIGRTGETNPRMLIAVKSTKLNIGLQIRGLY